MKIYRGQTPQNLKLKTFSSNFSKTSTPLGSGFMGERHNHCYRYTGQHSIYFKSINVFFPFFRSLHKPFEELRSTFKPYLVTHQNTSFGSEITRNPLKNWNLVSQSITLCVAFIYSSNCIWGIGRNASLLCRVWSRN